MSIYIKGMERPKNCGECPCYYDGYCHGMQYREEDEDYRAVSYREYDKKRRDDCPLVELPPHGRLIDADAIPYKKIMLDEDDDEFYYGVTQPYIDRMPTIIESEYEDGSI